ncbi:hypothetical protein N9544_02235 [Flavobacteriales bacterium]|jgi:hypothetical protein|nr:hypothetical protein [Flavobacteriales bacterium]
MKNIIAPFLFLTLLISCETNTEKKSLTDNSEIKELSSNNELNENIYTNDDLNISFSYPKSWEIQTDTMNGILYILSPTDSSDLFQEMMNIVIGNTNGLSLEEFFSMNLNAVEGMFDELDRTEDPSEISINNKVFKQVKFNYVFESYPLTANLFVTHKDETSYVVNCSALQNTFDKYQDQFMSVVNSIEIK